MHANGWLCSLLSVLKQALISVSPHRIKPKCTAGILVQGSLKLHLLKTARGLVKAPPGTHGHWPQQMAGTEEGASCPAHLGHIAMTWAFRLPHEASAPYLANCKDMSTFQFPVKIPGWKLKGTHKPAIVFFSEVRNSGETTDIPRGWCTSLWHCWAHWGLSWFWGQVGSHLIPPRLNEVAGACTLGGVVSAEQGITLHFGCEGARPACRGKMLKLGFNTAAACRRDRWAFGGHTDV